MGLQSAKFTGGEPLLCRHIRELLAFLAVEELTISVETNAILIDRQMLESFQSCNVEQISVSLDAASEEVHDEIRGIKGSFGRAVEGLGLVSGTGLNLQIIMTLQRKNRKEILGLILLREKVRASSLKLNLLNPNGRALDAFSRRDNLELAEKSLSH